jgi:hypothetical protein
MDQDLTHNLSSHMWPQTEVTELPTISCLASHAKIGVGKQQGILNRSKGMVHPTFIDDRELVIGMEM